MKHHFCKVLEDHLKKMVQKYKAVLAISAI